MSEKMNVNPFKNYLAKLLKIEITVFLNKNSATFRKILFYLTKE